MTTVSNVVQKETAVDQSIRTKQLGASVGDSLTDCTVDGHKPPTEAIDNGPDMAHNRAC